MSVCNLKTYFANAIWELFKKENVWKSAVIILVYTLSASDCCAFAHKAHSNGFSASELSAQPTGGGSGTCLVEPTYVLYCQCDRLVYGRRPSGAATHLDNFCLFWKRKKCCKCFTRMPKWQPLDQFCFGCSGSWYNWFQISIWFRASCWKCAAMLIEWCQCRVSMILLCLNMPFSSTGLLQLYVKISAGGGRNGLV